MDVSGVESVADPKHAEAVVNKNLADKDRTVRAPSEDSNESTISPVLCKPEEVKVCRADAARGSCLGTWTDQTCSAARDKIREPRQSQQARITAKP